MWMLFEILRIVLFFQSFPNPIFPEEVCLYWGKELFVEENDKQNIKRYFPNVEIQTIPGAEHYLHYSHSSEFLQIVEDFLLK